MATTIDPAQELGEMALRMTKGSTAPGAKYLGEQFGLEPWSTEFYRVLTSILERVDLIASIVERSALDDTARHNALEVLNQFKVGFSGEALLSAWSDTGLATMREQGRKIQYLSPTVREEIKYPRLTAEEVSGFLSLIDAYVDDLNINDEGSECIRRAIRQSLGKFRFQLEWIGWMGAGYALDAFKQVILVYESSHRQLSINSFRPSMLVNGLGSLLAKVNRIVDTAKDWADDGEFKGNTYRLAEDVLVPLLPLNIANDS